MSKISKASFIGIDLTSSQKKSSAYAALASDLKIIFLGFFNTDLEIITAIEQHEPRLIAIDAPLGFPEGLCCLEESCSCQPVSTAKGRVCERELAEQGIPCFFTTKKSIIKEMVYRAIGLQKTLFARGHEVVETYPYASKVRLFGKPFPSKLTPGGLEVLKGHLIALIPDIASRRKELSHDLCDAAIAAYTAYLHWGHKTLTLGKPEEGQIVIPA